MAPWLLGQAPQDPPQALPGSPRASPWPLWAACPAGCENECANLVKKKPSFVARRPGASQKG